MKLFTATRAAAFYITAFLLSSTGLSAAESTETAERQSAAPRIIDGTRELGADKAIALLHRSVPKKHHTSAIALALKEQRSTSYPLYANTGAKLLQDGPQTYAAMLAEIASAKRTVHMESFIFADDEIGQKFSAALIAASQRGVAVRLIVDGLANIGTDEKLFERLQQQGVAVRKYHPPDPTEDLRLWKINNRNHRKLLVVDSVSVFVGGVNITSIYGSSSQSDPGPDKGLKQGWRDTHVHIRGAVARSFERLFESNWGQSGEPEVLLGEPTRAHKRAAGPHLVRAIASEGGDGKEKEIYDVYLTAIEHAEETLWITHAYFSPDDAMLDAIVAAAERGVDVRIILPGFIDFGLIFHASRSNYDRILSAGVRIFERHDALLHSKTTVVDGYWATVGSANLDMRSFLHNDEVNATVLGEDFGKQMQQMFLADADEAKEMTLTRWRERGVIARLKEFFSKRLNYWL